MSTPEPDAILHHDDLDFERLPNGSVITDPRDVRYLRSLRERATLNRPDEPEGETIAAEQLLGDLNELREQKAELIALLEESETRNRDLKVLIASLFQKDRSYSPEVERLLAHVSMSNDTSVRATIAYLLASSGRWVRLKDAPSLSGVPLQTIRDWIDAGSVRWGYSSGHHSGQRRGPVGVFLEDVFVQKYLRCR
jgi:hypothetical protein